MEGTDFLVIGAGVAGLYSAKLLSEAGKRVIVLEARDRMGGRINTITDPKFELPVECGAEFVHGELDATYKLLKEAGLQHYAIDGELWRAQHGKLEKQEDFIEDQEELLTKLKALEHDMSVHDFLQQYFTGEKYTDLRKSLTSFVEGYDAADSTRASCFALLQELLGEEGEQSRVKGGYTQLVDYLAAECRKSGCEIHLSTVVSSVEWSPGKATITTTGGRSFSAPKVLITVPIGVLQSASGQEGHIAIKPLPPVIHECIHALGNTGVIKVILQFKEPFWKESSREQTGKTREISFVFSEAVVPTWWTQLPEDNGMITGWLAGRASLELKHEPDEAILDKALASLAEIFSTTNQELQSKLVAWHVCNWITDPFTRGAYAYETVDSQHAKRILNAPIANTIYFAGEAYHEGPERGTVEAALLSALRMGRLINED